LTTAAAGFECIEVALDGAVLFYIKVLVYLAIDCTLYIEPDEAVQYGNIVPGTDGWA
jgi:hypothetical protein